MSVTGTFLQREVEREVVFMAGPAALPVTVAKAESYGTAGGEALHLVLTLDYATWRTLDDAHAFAFTPDSIAPTRGYSLTSGVPIEVTVRADDDLVPAGVEGEARLDALLAALETEAGRDAGRYRWLSVMQAIAPGSPIRQGINSKFPPRD